MNSLKERNSRESQLSTTNKERGKRDEEIFDCRKLVPLFGMENKIFLKCRTWRENLAREAEHPRKSTGKVRPTCVLFSSSFTLAKM